MKNQQIIIENIEKYGCHIIHIKDKIDAVEDEPEFSYSIGLYERFKQPEIIIIGLRQEIRHSIINDVCFKYQQNKPLIINAFNADILEGFDCFVVEMDKEYYDEYLGQAIQYYQDKSFPAAQIIYPTIKGIFPWDKEFPKDVKEPILNAYIWKLI